MVNKIINIFGIASKHRFYSIVLLFIILLGTIFGNFNIFIDSVLKSKWYWCYITVSISSLLLLFIKTKTKFNINHLNFLLILLFIYCFIRTLTGCLSTLYIADCLLFFLMYYLFIKIQTDETFLIFSGIITTMAFFMSTYAIIQYIGTISSDSQIGIKGFFDNPVGLSSMLTFSLPFVLYFTFLNNKYEKYMAWSIYIIIVIGVILSASRTGILCIFIITLLFLAKHYKHIFRKIISKIVMIVLVIFFIYGLYLINKNSSNGRILIWKCTWEMIKGKPIFGHGYKSFKAEYMFFQANYFKQNEDSKFTLLSDNIKHPFNEFILLIVEFGFFAFILVILILIKAVVIYRKSSSNEVFVQILALLVIVVFSNFSYPFQYPFTWFVTAFSLKSLSVHPTQYHYQNQTYNISNILVLILSLTLFVFKSKEIYFERKWSKTLNMISIKNSHDIIIKYNSLYPHFKQNAYFLYNYAVILNHFREYNKSIIVLEKCVKYWNDYDLQILIATNYYNLKEWDKAECHYYKASNMCPNRFIPLYKIYDIYIRTDRKDDALRIAKTLIRKEVKVPSPTISVIKTKMKKYLDSKVYINK